ncbi:MAG TPA: alkaline phosphatase family protein [Planctomycetota bacterium]|nr:alkaline phosphatase family protein [Planctomycetota bacterium]
MRELPLRARACFVLASLAALTPPLLGAQAPSAGRVVLLGFDGADARTVSEMMARGELANLARLAERGTFAPLSTTNPSESAAAWAALGTGQNPAKTGVPGFVMRVLSPGERMPQPDFGFWILGEEHPIESFEGTPIPTWSPLALALVAGLGAALVFLVVFGLLLRLHKGPTLALSLALGAIAAWGAGALRGYLPPRMSKVGNPLQATPFWEVAARAGVRSVALDAAMAFDREPVEGARVLAGLGVPDALGTYMNFTVYTTDELWFAQRPGPETDTGSAGNRLKLLERDGVLRGEVFGPPNTWRIERLRAQVVELEERLDGDQLSGRKQAELERELDSLEDRLGAAQTEPVTLPLEVRKDGKGRATVAIGGKEQSLAEGEWSDFYHLTFELNPLLKVRAIARVKILHLDQPHFEMLLDPLQIDPAAPPFWQPISQPAGYAPELAKRNGTFETIGWACLNMPFKDGVIDPVTFMEDIEFTLRWRERMTLDALDRGDWQLLFSCFSTPDRVQHMMYQYLDRAHPMYDEAAAAKTMTFFGEEVALRDAIPAIYRQVDRVVGEVMGRLGPEDTLLLCSDHGFQSFRREVHVNNWLAEKGYLVPVERIPSKRAADLIGGYVDWSKTSAYSVGLGMVYLNLKGREGKGIVEPAEADALLRSIRQDFLDSTDPQTGEPFGREAYLAKEIHHGPFLDKEADLMLGFREGYRVSWGTTLGGLNVERSDGGVLTPAAVVTDNKKNWSGDHVSVDPELVRGIFFSSRKLRVPEGGVDLLHVAPTLLALLGVAVPPEYDLAPLQVQE